MTAFWSPIFIKQVGQEESLIIQSVSQKKSHNSHERSPAISAAKDDMKSASVRSRPGQRLGTLVTGSPESLGTLAARSPVTQVGLENQSRSSPKSKG